MQVIKVMLVDDEQMALEDLEDLIDWESLGYRIIATAKNGKQALKKYREMSPDLVITDIQMPVMDGIELAEQLSQEKKAPAMLFLSAYSDFEYARKAFAYGVNDYLLKNEINSEQLRTKLTELRKKILLYHSKEDTLREKIVGWMEGEENALPISKQKTGAELNVYRLHDAFKALDKDGAASHIREVFRQVMQRQNYEELIQVSSSLLQVLETWAEESGLSKTMDLSPETNAKFWSSPQNVQEWFEVKTEELFDQIDIGARKNLSPAIHDTIKYIQKHFGEIDLKIGDIAEAVGMSESRISVLFKKETGQTINEYITAVRIKRAAILLRQGRFRMYEIAERVGYGSAQYFSQVFVKYMGKTPTEYRDEESEEKNIP